MVYQETSKLPVGAKSEELASFEFTTTHSPDGSISSGFHEVQLSESLSEPAHRHSVDFRLSQPVGSHSKNPCHEGAFQEDASDDTSAVHRCLTASRSCITGLKLDSNTLLLHPPLGAVTAQSCSSEVESDQSEIVRRDNNPVGNNCEIDLGPAGKLWMGQPHPVTFADGTTRIFSWSLVGDTIVGTTVGEGDGRMDVSTNHPLIEDQSKTDEMEEEDSTNDPEILHVEDQMVQPCKTTTSNLSQTRDPSRSEDYSESVTSEDPEATQTPEPNTSLLATHQESFGNKNQLTSTELAASACGCDNLERVRTQGNVGNSHPDNSEEFDREIDSEDTSVSKDSAPEERISSRQTSTAMRCYPVQARRKDCDESSIDGDTSSVFSADAGVPDRYSGHSKLALSKCNSNDSVLSSNSTINRAMWFDIGGQNSRVIAPEVDGTEGSVSSEFFRKSGVSKTDKRSTLEASKVDLVNARKPSSSSIKKLSVTSKTPVSKTDSISSPVGGAGDNRWKSVTDLTRATGSRSTSDAYSQPTSSVCDPQVASDLAKRLAAINTRFRTMAAEAVSRRESGNFKEPDKAQSTGLRIGTRTEQTHLEDGDSTGTDISWKFDGSLKRSFNEPDRIGLENGRPPVTKDRYGSKIVEDSIKESGETPAVSGTLAMTHAKTALDDRQRRSGNRKYSSSGDLRFRFSEDVLSFPTSVSPFSDSSSSHVPSKAVNHNGRLTDAVRQPLVQDVDETSVTNRPRKKTMHEQLEDVRSQVDQWHKDLTLNSRLRYANMFDGSE